MVSTGFSVLSGVHLSFSVAAVVNLKTLRSILLPRFQAARESYPLLTAMAETLPFLCSAAPPFDAIVDPPNSLTSPPVQRWVMTTSRDWQITLGFTVPLMSVPIVFFCRRGSRALHPTWRSIFQCLRLEILSIFFWWMDLWFQWIAKRRSPQSRYPINRRPTQHPLRRDEFLV